MILRNLMNFLGMTMTNYSHYQNMILLRQFNVILNFSKVVEIVFFSFKGLSMIIGWFICILKHLDHT